jgi:hypothetical protein
MKRILTFLTILSCMVFMASSAFAAWTITISSVRKSDNYVWFDALCTSDGSALTAVDILSSTYMGYAKDVQGSTLMLLYVSPGTVGVAPDNTFDVTLTDDLGATIWADTAISNVTGSWHKMYEDLGPFPPILDELNLAISDIGTSGDQVTLRFILWAEK